MKDLHELTDEELQKKIADSLEIALGEGKCNPYNSWFRQMHIDLVRVYQNEQKRRQTERCIGVVEELTDVIR